MGHPDAAPHAAGDEEAEQRVLEAARAVGLGFEQIWIDPAYAATADFCDRYGYQPGQSGNCIVVASRTDPVRYAACVVRATRRLDVNKRVRKLMGVRRASFAPAEDTVRLTGMLPDGVTPFGLPDDLPLYLDEGLLAHDAVIVGGGSRRLKLAVPPEALCALPGAEVVADLALPQRE
jgi:prolyl-tRNA editing enzyme YbaK/EbsC (Cys-tRNA(Pro) deacylase)